MHDFLRVRYQRHDIPVLEDFQHCGVYPGVAPPTSHQVPLSVVPDSQLDVHFLLILTNLPTTADASICLTHCPGLFQSHTELSTDGSFTLSRSRTTLAVLICCVFCSGCWF